LNTQIIYNKTITAEDRCGGTGCLLAGRHVKANSACDSPSNLNRLHHFPLGL